jgi:hypothetical protein
MKSKLFSLFIGCYLASGSMTSFADTTNPQVEALDKEIKEYKNAKERKSMEAYEEGSSADQHLSQDWMDYEEDIQNQEMHEKEVKELDEKIKQLEQQKEALQKKTPPSNPLKK